MTGLVTNSTARPPRRRGLSLIEMSLAMSVMVVLTGGVIAATLIATRSIDLNAADDPQGIRATEILNMVTQDLRFAVDFGERTDHAVTFSVPDRDTDGVPEKLRYAWSGTAGDPLTRSYNGADAVDILEDVHDFNLEYLLQTAYPDPQACCYGDGNCQDQRPDDCRTADGAPQGAGTNCAGTVCPIITSALIAHWNLDDGAGLTAVDVVGGHDGTLTHDPSWGTGFIDGGLSFDGYDDFINVPHDDALSLTNMTISLWINPTALKNVDQVLLRKKQQANYALVTREDEIGFAFNDWGWVFFWTTAANLTTEQWYHVAVSFDDNIGECRIYVDGVLSHTGTTTMHPQPNSDVLTIGGIVDPVATWPGMIDDLRIYNQALSATAISDLFAEAGGMRCGDSHCVEGETPCDCAADCGAAAASEGSLCADGIDNDCDTLADCDDVDCINDTACAFVGCGDGTCAAGEDCVTCLQDCPGVAQGKPANQHCCGNGTLEAAEGDGSLCDGNP